VSNQDEGIEHDTRLIRRAAGGDRAAFDVLVARHQAAVYRFLRSLGAGETDAEEALQETFLAAWRGAEGFRGDATLRSWLLTIARHTAFRLRRRRAGQPPVFESLDDLGARAGWGEANPPRWEDRLADHDLLARALAALSPEDREVLVLRELEGLSTEETAMTMGLKVATTRTRLHRARLSLAARVRAELGHAE
jgi:RNA polymerase sigma-70 factor (ECF subfamily)